MRMGIWPSAMIVPCLMQLLIRRFAVPDHAHSPCVRVGGSADLCLPYSTTPSRCGGALGNGSWRPDGGTSLTGAGIEPVAQCFLPGRDTAAALMPIGAPSAQVSGCPPRLALALAAAGLILAFPALCWFVAPFFWLRLVECDAIVCRPRGWHRRLGSTRHGSAHGLMLGPIRPRCLPALVVDGGGDARVAGVVRDSGRPVSIPSGVSLATFLDSWVLPSCRRGLSADAPRIIDNPKNLFSPKRLDNLLLVWVSVFGVYRGAGSGVTVGPE